MAAVVWIVDAEHWPRAGLRAELIERGYDAIGFPTLRDAVLGLGRTRRPALLVVDLQGQDLDAGDLDQLLGLNRPVIAVADLVHWSDASLHLRSWSVLLRRPIAVGAIADVVDRLAGRRLRPTGTGATSP